MRKALASTLLCLTTALSLGVFAQQPKLNNREIQVSTLRGKISATGVPFRTARVQVTNLATQLSRTATTTSNGEFVFPQLPDGAYEVTASAEGFDTKTVRAQVTTQPATVNILLDSQREGRISVLVLNREAKAKPNVRVQVQYGSGGSPYQGLTDSGGAFNLYHLGAGLYTITIPGEPSKQAALATNKTVSVEFVQ